MAKSDIKEKRVYGRRQNRPLKGERLDAYQTLLPRLALSKEQLKEDASLDPRTLFSSPFKELWFEIGFGSGEHLAELMRRQPDNAFLGAEPFINGMAAFLRDIAEMPHDNIRVHMDDAMMLANSLADESVDGLYILNADPWHKKRHHKRRIIRRETLDCFHRILKPGGHLIASTDVPYLAEWIITEVTLHGGFEWTANKADDWRVRPDDWITTAYEVKGAKGATQMSYLLFQKA
ncbi:MAG: tRNA (guanosine(46)-N7)-methyltransferase TrmB [Micavibrio sp.]|nr:tRNA (guanosine(46)-N7)-methyltransferase TrmB [Micavibrio sp.]